MESITNKKILHYEIIEKLGEGGMGVVYKAHDTRLKRDVAIKFLPRKPAAGEERQRFRIEAQAAAALNHPNIATIHAIEEDNGAHFIVMEYIEGHNLEQLTIDNRQLSIENVIRYATQIAAGLQAAHTKGIVHRDIKASNVMVTAESQIKITDFGLAKFHGATQLTRTGATLGTFAYMSPEQASGGKVDHRTDIWSFGVLLYQMLTGKLPFAGDNEAALLYAILHDEPRPIAEIRPDVSPQIARCIEVALRKEPDERPAAVKAFSDVFNGATALHTQKPAIRGMRSRTAAASSKSVSVRQGPVKFVIPLAASVLIALIIYFVFLDKKSANQAQLPLLAAPLTSYPGYEYDPALSPDGNMVAFSWNGQTGVNFDIYVKQIESGEPLRITSDPRGEFRPAWSRDGQYLAFVRVTGDENDEIHIVPALGGLSRRVTSYTSHMHSAVDWAPDGKSVLFSDRDPSGPYAIFAVSVESCERQKLTTPIPGSRGDTTPRISPDGKTLAFFRFGYGMNPNIFIKPLTNPEVSAQRVTLADDPLESFCWARDGKSLIFTGHNLLDFLKSVDISSGEIRQFSLSGGVFEPSTSLAKDRLVFQHSNGKIDIWAIGLDSAGVWAPILTSTWISVGPGVSPDGRKIAFSSNRSGSFEVWIGDIDGINPIQMTRMNNNDQASIVRWSPDGRHLVFHARQKNVLGIFTIDVQTGTLKPLTGPELDAYLPSWSRDGKWVYFTSDYQIWKASADGGSPIQMTYDGGTTPQESHDGKYLFYHRYDRISPSGEGEIWRMPVAGGEATRVFSGVKVSIERSSPAMDRPSSEWIPGKSGIYYQAQDERGNACIDLFDFETGESRRLAAVPGPGDMMGIGLSPDEKTAFIPRHEGTGSDIIMVDNFR